MRETVRVIGGRIFVHAEHIHYKDLRWVAWSHVTEVIPQDDSACHISWTGDQAGDTWIVEESAHFLFVALNAASGSLLKGGEDG